MWSNWSAACRLCINVLIVSSHQTLSGRSPTSKPSPVASLPISNIVFDNWLRKAKPDCSPQTAYWSSDAHRLPTSEEVNWSEFTSIQAALKLPKRYSPFGDQGHAMNQTSAKYHLVVTSSFRDLVVRFISQIVRWNPNENSYFINFRNLFCFRSATNQREGMLENCDYCARFTGCHSGVTLVAHATSLGNSYLDRSKLSAFEV